LNPDDEGWIVVRCTACDTPMEVDTRDCVEGGSCFCNFCGAESRFVRERTVEGHPLCWALMLTDMEYADDERR
jgi:hypothetical protein